MTESIFFLKIILKKKKKKNAGFTLHSYWKYRKGQRESTHFAEIN